MNRIETLFQSGRRDLLSIYFCAGTPRPDATADTIRALERHGVDLIEIGIPFSDPMADGPVIQRAATDALRHGMTLRRLFDDLTDIRRDVRLPLILMGYLNPILRFGFEAFCARCAEVGIDGVIIPDLPFADYMTDYRPLAQRYGLDMIMLITPETSEERIRAIDSATDGFLYMVSSASTTGARDAFDAPTLDYFRRIATLSLRNPRMIGFGVSNRATFSDACRHASGAIIGSRFVSLLEEEGGDATRAIVRLKEAIGGPTDASEVWPDTCVGGVRTRQSSQPGVPGPQWISPPPRTMRLMEMKMAGCAPQRVWPGTGLTGIRQTSPAAAAAHGRRHCGRGRHVYDTCLEACGGVCAAHVVRKVVLAEGRVVRQQAADTGVSLGACLPLCFGGELCETLHPFAVLLPQAAGFFLFACDSHPALTPLR